MELLSSGTTVGPGSFRCQRCDYVLTLSGADELGECPRCAGRQFVRASMFSTERLSSRSGAPHGDELAPNAAGDLSAGDRDAQLTGIRERIERAGQYLCFEADGELRTVALTREWTRIGRSLAADLRFDDATVSRRHALLVRQADGVRVLDDRSLNGVFVNGARVEGKTLADGDEIVIGRHRLSFLDIALHSSST